MTTILVQIKVEYHENMVTFDGSWAMTWALTALSNLFVHFMAIYGTKSVTCAG